MYQYGESQELIMTKDELLDEVAIIIIWIIAAFCVLTRLGYFPMP